MIRTIHDSVDFLSDFQLCQLTVDINPYDTVGEWSNVFHFTATGDNCCHYGDRIPALFIRADSSEMHFVMVKCNAKDAMFGF